MNIDTITAIIAKNYKPNISIRFVHFYLPHNERSHNPNYKNNQKLILSSNISIHKYMYLLSHKNKYYLLITSIKENKIEYVKYLQKIVRTTYNDKLCPKFLYVQYYENPIEIVRILLDDKNENPFVYNNTVLYNAAKHKYFDVLKLLLKDERSILALSKDERKKYKRIVQKHFKKK